MATLFNRLADWFEAQAERMEALHDRLLDPAWADVTLRELVTGRRNTPPPEEAR